MQMELSDKRPSRAAKRCGRWLSSSWCWPQMQLPAPSLRLVPRPACATGRCGARGQTANFAYRRSRTWPAFDDHLLHFRGSDSYSTIAAPPTGSEVGGRDGTGKC